EPADSLRNKSNVSGGWLRSLTYIYVRRHPSCEHFESIHIRCRRRSRRVFALRRGEHRAVGDHPALISVAEEPIQWRGAACADSVKRGMGFRFHSRHCGSWFRLSITCRLRVVVTTII